jgi:hypothetical protein
MSGEEAEGVAAGAVVEGNSLIRFVLANPESQPIMAWSSEL